MSAGFPRSANMSNRHHRQLTRTCIQSDLPVRSSCPFHLRLHFLNTSTIAYVHWPPCPICHFYMSCIPRLSEMWLRMYHCHCCICPSLHAERIVQVEGFLHVSVTQFSPSTNLNEHVSSRLCPFFPHFHSTSVYTFSTRPHSPTRILCSSVLVCLAYMDSPHMRIFLIDPHVTSIQICYVSLIQMWKWMSHRLCFICPSLHVVVQI